MSKLIKLVYIIDKLGTNLAGTENQLIKMINGLDHGKFEIDLVCLNDHPWLKENASSLKCKSTVIEINKFIGLSTYLCFLKLVWFLRKRRPDIVHTFFPVGNIAGVLAAKLAGAPNIISSRRDYGEWIDRRYLFGTNISNRYVKRIVTNSNEVKKFTEKVEKSCQDKIEVIGNGIDTALFHEMKPDHGLKRKLNIPEGDKVVGIVANFRPMKRHRTFIEAASEMLKIRKDLSFILIGEGPTQEEAERLGQTLKIDHKLRFMGAQREVVPCLSIMDVGVNCSEMEGLSNAIMEYMTAGIPCVVSNSGGNPNLIAHNLNGYTFSLDDSKTLADLTLRLLNERETREKFIKNSREKIEKEMSLGRIISTYESFYEKMVNVDSGRLGSEDYSRRRKQRARG